MLNSSVVSYRIVLHNADHFGVADGRHVHPWHPLSTGLPPAMSD